MGRRWLVIGAWYRERTAARVYPELTRVGRLERIRGGRGRFRSRRGVAYVAPVRDVIGPEHEEGRDA